jgi:hypothetical protein
MATTVLHLRLVHEAIARVAQDGEKSKPGESGTDPLDSLRTRRQKRTVISGMDDA